MKKEFCAWQDEEVKTLFKFVEVKKSEGVPLIKIFDEFAKCTSRQQNSVRNYYYKEIKHLNENKDRLIKLGINLKNHLSKTPEPFSENDTKNVIENIKKLINEGYSVRGACLKLAGGNATKMVRYQNKYRSEVKYKKVEKMEKMDNIIKMPIKKDIMSDEDINALFLGLVKLVKKQEASKAKMLFENELVHANEKLKRAIIDIANKQSQIEKLKTEISVLNKKVSDKYEINAMNNVKLAKKFTSANQVFKDFVSAKAKENQRFLNVT